MYVGITRRTVSDNSSHSHFFSFKRIFFCSKGTQEQNNVIKDILSVWVDNAYPNAL